MTVLDDKLVPKVLELINKFGVDVVWRHDVVETYNPNTGEGRKEDAIVVTIKMTPPEIKQLMFNNVMTAMTVFLAAGGGLTNVPEVNDQLELASVKYTIVALKQIWSGAQIAAYEFRCQ